MPKKKFVPTQALRYIYPEEVELFIRCPYLFNTLKTRQPATSLIQSQFENRAVVSLIRAAYNQKSRRGDIPTWKKLRMIANRVIHEEVDRTKKEGISIEKIDLDRIIFPVEYWYRNYLEKDFSTSEAVGITIHVPLNNKEDRAAVLKFDIPVFLVEQNGIGAIIYSPSLSDFRVSALRRNVIVRMIIWGISKYVGYNFRDNFNRVRILNVRDSSADFVNIPVKNIILNEEEIQYLLWGMSNRISCRNRRNECSDCSRMKEECYGTMEE